MLILLSVKDEKHSILWSSLLRIELLKAMILFSLMIGKNLLDCLSLRTGIARNDTIYYFMDTNISHKPEPYVAALQMSKSD